MKIHGGPGGLVEPAFPGIETPGGGYPGMTLRDYFAALAMHGYLVSPQTAVDAIHNSDTCAEWAYFQADAMLKERDK